MADNLLLVASMGMQELRHIVLPYQSDALLERQGLAFRATEALSRASGVSPLGDFPPTVAALPLMLLDGRWAEARRSIAGPWHGPWRGLLAGIAVALALAQGEPDAAWATIRAILPAGPATKPGDDDYRETLPLQRLAASLALDAGDLLGARAWLEAHDRWLAWSRDIAAWTEGQLSWAAYQRVAGEPAAAHAHAARALTAASAPRQPLALLAAHRLLGELATEGGDHSGAAAHLLAARTLADACAAPYERALTLLALADLRRAMNEPGVAQRLVVEARDLAAALGAVPMVARADAMLALLAAVRADAQVYPAGLSAREVEILRHVAAGRANRDIATILSLSEHTVRAHVRHIFAKTGADNRAAATAFAFQHHLT